MPVRWHSRDFAREPVPLLAQALDYCRARSIWVNVEIKPSPGHEVRTGAVVRGCCRAYVDLVRTGGDDAARLDPRVPLLSSFAEEAIVAARGAARDLPRALLVDPVPMTGEHACSIAWARCRLHTNHRPLTPPIARAVKSAGYWLFCYTVNDPQRARELLRGASMRSAPTAST